MRHCLAVVFFVVSNLLVCNPAAFAQDTPKAEVFAGYSYGNYELMAGAPSTTVGTTTISGFPSARLGTNGWNAAVAVNMNRWFSFATDFSGYYSGSSASSTSVETFSCGTGCTQTNTIVDTDASPKIYNFLFGPQFSYPAGKIRPFAHFLVGGEHADMTRTTNITTTGGEGVGIIGIGAIQPAALAETGFAMALGGGADYSIKRNLAWRLQADYLTSQAGLAQNHVRVSTGLVWRLGN